MAKVKNPHNENNEDIIFTKKKSTEDGFTHYTRIRNQNLKKKPQSGSVGKPTIRRATSKDLDDVQRLNFDLFKKEHKEFDKSLDMKWTHSKQGMTYFKKRTSGKDGFCVVAENNGKIVGYLCGGSYECGYREKAVYTELENMIVDKKLRGKGIGTMLTNEFFKWCKDKKAKYISVKASVQNKQGIKFYRSLGFKDYDLTLEINNFSK